MGQLIRMRTYPTAEYRDVPGANTDTLPPWSGLRSPLELAHRNLSEGVIQSSNVLALEITTFAL